MEDFMESFARDNEEDLEPDNFAAGYINRNGFSIVYKQPFLDWIKKIEANSSFPIEVDDPTEYLLLEEMNTNDDIANWLKKNYNKVFRKELEGWSPDEKTWPTNRTYKMFTEWIDVKFTL